MYRIIYLSNGGPQMTSDRFLTLAAAEAARRQFRALGLCARVVMP